MSQPTTSPLDGLPPLLAELSEAFEKRRTTPTSQCVNGPLLARRPVELTEAEHAAYDAWKASGGPARDNQAQAEKLDLQYGPSMRAAGFWL